MTWTAERLQSIFASHSYDTPGALAAALNDIEDSLYDLAYTVTKSHLRHCLRYIMSHDSSGDHYRSLMYKEIPIVDRLPRHSPRRPSRRTRTDRS